MFLKRRSDSRHCTPDTLCSEDARLLVQLIPCHGGRKWRVIKKGLVRRPANGVGVVRTRNFNSMFLKIATHYRKAIRNGRISFRDDSKNHIPVISFGAFSSEGPIISAGLPSWQPHRNIYFHVLANHISSSFNLTKTLIAIGKKVGHKLPCSLRRSAFQVPPQIKNFS